MPATEVDINAYDCSLCWDTGRITVNQTGGEGEGVPVERPCPEGCLAPGEVPF